MTTTQEQPRLLNIQIAAAIDNSLTESELDVCHSTETEEKTMDEERIAQIVNYGAALTEDELDTITTDNKAPVDTCSSSRPLKLDTNQDTGHHPLNK